MFTTLLIKLFNDEAGFIVSAEMVLIGTITVLGMVVGLAEVAFNVNKELGDVADAFSRVNQSQIRQGESQNDHDYDSNNIVCDTAPTPEGY